MQTMKPNRLEQAKEVASSKCGGVALPDYCTTISESEAKDFHVIFVKSTHNPATRTYEYKFYKKCVNDRMFNKFEKVWMSSHEYAEIIVLHDPRIKEEEKPKRAPRSKKADEEG